MTKAVYIDFDDVLCETARALSVMIEREFGKKTAFEDIFSFDLNVSFGLDDSETERLFELFNDPDVLAAIAPVDGAVAGVKAWHDAGANIHIVTGRPPSTHAASAAWLDAYHVPYDAMTFVDKYGRNHALVDGVDIITLEELRSREFCMAVDDSPVAIQFLVEHTQLPIVIYDRPWNACLSSLDESPRITRCQTWSELLEKIPDATVWKGM
jgi:hypothetical protein